MTCTVVEDHALFAIETCRTVVYFGEQISYREGHVMMFD